MKNQIQNIVDELKKDKFTVLMTSTHPMTDTNICGLDYNFINLAIKEFPIKWPKSHPLPKNMKIVNSIDEIPYRPDVILSQNIVDQYNIFKQLSLFFDCPIVQFEHTLPTDAWKNGGVRERLLKDAHPTMYGFITDFSRKEWLRDNIANSFTINHMVDTDFFKPMGLVKDSAAMVMVNAFKTREWAVGAVDRLLQKAIENNVIINFFGHNDGFNSTPLSKDMIPITLNKHKIFINTSVRSPIPASLLEAASCGSVILSTKTCAIPEFFINNESIIYFNDFNDCIAKIKEIDSNFDKYKHIGDNARNVVLEKFSRDRYLLEWENIFKKAIELYHV